jgi:transposase
MKKRQVILTAEQRQGLLEMIAAGKASAQRLSHARILLKADASEGGPAWTDEKIADAVEVSIATAERVRQRFVEQGLEAALDRKKQQRPSRVRKLDGAAQAHLLALADSEPPDGRACWTMQLLADKLVELRIVDSICDESVRRTLRKRNEDMANGARRHRCPGQRRVGLQQQRDAGELPPPLPQETVTGTHRRGQPTVDRCSASSDSCREISAEAG